MSAVTHESIELAPVAVEGGPKLPSRVSWGAIFAGAFALGGVRNRYLLAAVRRF